MGIGGGRRREGDGRGRGGREREGGIVIVFAGMTYFWDKLIAASLRTSDLVPSFLYLQFYVIMR